MKVLMLNGSPHPNGCTFTALDEMRKVFDQYGVKHELIQIGRGAIQGCTACGACRSRGSCIHGDLANEIQQKLGEADGFIVGSPVYYASPNGSLISLLDRVFYMHGNYAGKPAAAIVSCRRGGATAALEVLQKYFTITGMPIVSSTYWPMIHGNRPEEALQDAEGLQIMRGLAHNMVWMLKCMESGRREGILPQYNETKIFTNFIR